MRDLYPLPPELEELLDPERFRAWLETRLPTWRAITSPSRCPIAQYLADHGRPASVSATHILDRDVPCASPKWVQEFVRRFDATTRSPAGARRGKRQALQILRNALKAVEIGVEADDGAGA